MPRRYRTVRNALALILITGLSVGCSTITQTSTVKESDNYVHWAKRIDHIPFLFHYPDGHVEVLDSKGNSWPSNVVQAEAHSADRVEIYVGNFSGSAATLCAETSAYEPATIDSTDRNVVSALCDRSRTVVSLTEHRRPEVLATKATYLSRVRRLLLNCIWESPAQQPEPFYS